MGAAQYEDDDDGGTELIQEVVSQFYGDGMDFTQLVYNPASASNNTVAPFIDAYYK